MICDHEQPWPGVFLEIQNETRKYWRPCLQTEILIKYASSEYEAERHLLWARENNRATERCQSVRQFVWVRWEEKNAIKIKQCEAEADGKWKEKYDGRFECKRKRLKYITNELADNFLQTVSNFQEIIGKREVKRCGLPTRLPYNVFEDVVFGLMGYGAL